MSKSLTQSIHADLQAQGLMAVEPKPTRDQLLGRAKLPHRGLQRMPWEAPFAKQPRDYAVTALIAHLGTPRLLKLCVGFLLRQSVRPYVVIVDSGSPEAMLPDVFALRSEAVEVHTIACHGTDHAVAAACYAMDLGQTVCRTEYLWCVHSDCFVTRRTMLAELLAMADGGKNPCIGYVRRLKVTGDRLIGDRLQGTGDIRQKPTASFPAVTCNLSPVTSLPPATSLPLSPVTFVSHTCTLLHVPTLDDLDVTWSMRRLLRQKKGAAQPPELDTEMAVNYRLAERGVKPIILGPETLDRLEIDSNRVHLRAATARGLYLANGRDDSEIVGRLEKLLEDDGDVLPEQAGKEGKGEKGKRGKGDLKSPLPLFTSSPFPSFPRPTRLNLIYHVAPFAKSDVWQKNVRQLLRRIEMFNGHRIIAIATGEEMAPIDEVKAEFRFSANSRSEIRNPKFLLVPNDRTLRENASFLPLLEAVQSVDPDEATFYAHAKGVTTIGDAEGVMYWRNLMYHALLDDPEAIKDALTRYAIVGTHRMTMPTEYPDGKSGPWHFAGSYFWFRNDALFGERSDVGSWKSELSHGSNTDETRMGIRDPCSIRVSSVANTRFRRNWRDVPAHGWGVEAYPAAIFDLEESCCLAMDEPVNAYDPGTYPAELRFADEDGAGTSAALKIELGGGRTPRGQGFINVDVLDCADVRFNFDDLPASGPPISSSSPHPLPARRLPFDDDSALHVYSSHCLEHIADYRPLLREIVRIGAIGCRVEVRVPHWGHNMAMCYTHKHTITYEQVEHWCETAVGFWFGGCAKRLKHHSTARIPSRKFEWMKARHPGWTDDEIMEHVPDTCHEYRFLFNVVPNDLAAP